MSGSKSKQIRKYEVKQAETEKNLERIAHVLQTLSITETQAYSGPIPSPATLEEYNQVVPGLGDQLVGEYIKQGEHRRKLEQSEFEVYRDRGAKADTRALLGLIIGSIVAIILIGAGVYATWLKQSWVAGAIFGSIAAVIGVFVYQKFTDKPQAEQSSTDLAPVEPKPDPK